MQTLPKSKDLPVGCPFLLFGSEGLRGEGDLSSNPTPMKERTLIEAAQRWRNSFLPLPIEPVQALGDGVPGALPGNFRLAASPRKTCPICNKHQYWAHPKVIYDRAKPSLRCMGCGEVSSVSTWKPALPTTSFFGGEGILYWSSRSDDLV